MKPIIFKLPKILHDKDFFVQKLIIDKTEKWYGFGKEIQVSNDKEYLKINDNTIFTFTLNKILLLSMIPLIILPQTRRIFSDAPDCNDSYYSLGIGGHPFIVNKQEIYFFKLEFWIKNKKYIKFKENPIIHINIFNTF